jgi:hypothetical protein
VLSFVTEKEKEINLTPVRFRELYPSRKELHVRSHRWRAGPCWGF